MISLDIDFSYLNRCFNIGYDLLEKYRNKSITEIMEIEAHNGNSKAAQFLTKITSDPEELAKLFNLVDPKNRYMILMHMNEDDLMDVMLYLEPQQLVLGLSVLNTDVILNLMMKLEPECLATVVLEKMSADMFVEKLPQKYLDEFLTSNEIDKSIILKSMENVDEDQLQKMMENYTGESCYENRENIISKLSSLDDDKFKNALLSFEPKGKKQLTISILQKKPNLFEKFSPEAMVYPFSKMQKDDVLKSLTVLDTKDLLPMVEDLPQKIMALIATQIDADKFAKILCRNFADIITNCGIDL